MTTSSITVRVDEDTKTAAARIAEDFGFDLSSVTRAFYKQMIRENRVPLTLSYPEPNSESLASVEEAEKIIAKGSPGRFANAEQMYKDLGI